MPHGLFAMRDEALNDAYKLAMQNGCYATAERIAYELNEPGQLYLYRYRAKPEIVVDKPPLCR